MATRRRRGSGKQQGRAKPARTARARRAKAAVAARTAGARPPGKPSRPRKAGSPGAAVPLPRKRGDAGALRAAEQDAALAGAEVEPAGRPLASVSHLPSQEERDSGRLAEVEAATGAVTVDAWSAPEPSRDLSRELGGTPAGEASTPLGSAVTDLVRSGLGLARTVVAVPLRLALAVPRLVLRAVLS